MVVFDLLYNNFEIKTAPLLHFNYKDFEEIQQIVIFTEVANLAKQAVRVTTNLTIITKKK